MGPLAYSLTMVPHVKTLILQSTFEGNCLTMVGYVEKGVKGPLVMMHSSNNIGGNLPD